MTKFDEHSRHILEEHKDLQISLWRLVNKENCEEVYDGRQKNAKAAGSNHQHLF